MESNVKKWNSILFICFLSLVSFASGETSGLYSRGRALYLKGQYQKALTLYQKALKADKKNWIILQAIGDAYLNQGQRGEALRYYQLSLSAHPDNPTLEYFIGHPASTPAPPLSTPTPPYPSLKTLELSISAGKLLPVQTESNVQNWNVGWQESLYLGAQVSNHWAMGLQLDVMEPSNSPFLNLPPSQYTNPQNGSLRGEPFSERQVLPPFLQRKPAPVPGGGRRNLPRAY